MQAKSLREYFYRGYIAAPKETEKQFTYRMQTIESILQRRHPFSGKVEIVEYKGIKYLSSRGKKFFWQAGLTWIIPIEKEVYTGLVQIPKKRRRLSWDEVWSHEWIHVKRAMFNEPIFEEMIAFSSSSSKVRRWLGPLFRRNLEVGFFFFLLSLIIVCPWFDIPLLLGCIPLMIFFGALSFRLIYRGRQFYRCLRFLQTISDDPLDVVQCLTDQEIVIFSQQKIPHNDGSIRWQQIMSLLKTS